MSVIKYGLLSNAFWNIIAILVSAVSGFIIAPIIIHGIGADSYGIYCIILTVGGMLALQDLGLGEATLRFVAKYYAGNDLDGINRVFGATLSIYLLTGLLCCLLVLIFAPDIIALFKISPTQVPAAVMALRLASFSFVFITIGSAFQKVPEAIQRYDLSSKISVVLAILRCALIITAVKLGYGLVGLTFLLSLNALLIMLIYGILSSRLIPGLHRWPHCRYSGIKEVFGYGVFSFINQLIGNATNCIDSLVLGIFFGTSDVAFLTAPKNLLSTASSATGAAGQALFPKFSSMSDKAEMMQLYINCTWSLLCFSLTIFIPLIILMPEFLSLWISPEFSGKSAEIAQLIGLNFAILGVTIPYFTYLKGSGKIHYLTLIYFVSSGLSIGMAVILIKMYGLTGAGIRYCAISWTGILISVIILKKCLNPPRLLAACMRSIAIPILLSMSFALIANRLWLKIELHGWFWLILSYIVIAAGLLFVLIGADLLLYRQKGAASVILNKVNFFLKSFPTKLSQL